MSANGVKNLIAAVDLVFPAPQYGGDKKRQAGWIALYTSELAHYDDDVLAQVGKEIIRETKPEDGDGRFFPSIGKIRERCERLKAQKEVQKTPLLAGPKLDAFAPERFNLARDLMQSATGKQAQREGWGHEFYQFCVENMRAPSGNEIAACKEAAKKFQAEWDRCMKTPGITQAWAGYAQRMVGRVRELMEGSA